MGEQSSSRVTPMPAIILANAGKSWSIERNGHTWLPMGKPSGFAASFVALAVIKLGTLEPTASLLTNSRLEIVVIGVVLRFVIAVLRAIQSLSAAIAACPSP